MGEQTETLSPGALVGGKYRLERLLGKGGMGVVWQAENVDIGRRVAIKVLLPEIAADQESLARFRTEARAAAAIGHPGIAEVIDFGTTAEGGAYLVMEYLDGETLGARLRRAGALDVQTVGWLGDELLAAVAAAHAKGVVHRDLKPDNVFLVEQPIRTVKVLDFGVSKFRRPGDLALTKTGTVMGTPAYMSPEQARGAKDVGPATDLFAVGAILYEALAGAPAFKGDSYNEILAKVLTEPHRPLRELRPDVPPAVAAVVERLLAKPVAERPADAQEARGLLAQAVEEGPGSAELIAPTVRPGQLSASPSAPPIAPAAPTPAAVAAPVPTPGATAPAAASPLQARGGWKAVLRRWGLPVVGLFFAYRGCVACGNCFSHDEQADKYEAHEERVERREERREDRLDRSSAGLQSGAGGQGGAVKVDFTVGDGGFDSRGILEGVRQSLEHAPLSPEKRQAIEDKIARDLEEKAKRKGAR